MQLNCADGPYGTDVPRAAQKKTCRPHFATGGRHTRRSLRYRRCRRGRTSNDSSGSSTRRRLSYTSFTSTPFYSVFTVLS